MKLDLMREHAKVFPEIQSILEINAMRVWHCKYKSLRVLENFVELKELVIATFPDSDLDFLLKLNKLEHLRILHLPKVEQLEPLAGLPIKRLSFSVLPSWSNSRKYTMVDSLTPLGKLSSLENIELFGVRPKDESLEPLLGLENLKTARLSGYKQRDIDHFHQSRIDVKNAFNPVSSFGN